MGRPTGGKDKPFIVNIKGKPVEYWLVPFFSDFGFKTAWIKCKLFSKRAIQTLVGLELPITKLKMVRNEITPLTRDSKGGAYDVICQDERKQIFIVEMQAGAYKLLNKRLLFYLFIQYCSQVLKANKGNSFENLAAVHCICIIKDQLLKDPNYHNTFMFKNAAGEVFDKDVCLHLFELGKFPILRNQPELVVTDIQKLLFTMKYAHTLKSSERPDFMEEDWLKEAIEQLNPGKLDPQQRAFLEMELVGKGLERASRKMEMKEAREEAKAEGKAEERIKNVLRFYHLGFDVESIANFFELTVEQVKEILKKHDLKPHPSKQNGNGSNEQH